MHMKLFLQSLVPTADDVGFRATLGYTTEFRDIYMKRWTILTHRLDPRILGVLFNLPARCVAISSYVNLNSLFSV